MASRIEKMNRMRRNILLIVFLGSLIAFVSFIYPSVYRFFHFQEKMRFFITLLHAGIILLLGTIALFSVRYLFYKKALRKDPSLNTAVNDERVKLNWFKAYRFAFLVVFFFQCSLLLIQFLEAMIMPLHFLMPQIFLTLFLAIMSLVGSFLYYNREAKDG